MEEFNGKSQFKKLFNYQLIIGLLSNVLVAIPAYVYGETTLSTICTILFFLTIISYLVSRFLNFLLGVHFMLLSYYSLFLYSAFTPIVSYPTILIYPIILSLSVVYSKSKTIRLLYSILCFSACLCTVYLQQKQLGASLFVSEMLSPLLIATGLMIAFPVIIITNSNILNVYQKEQEENRSSLKHKNSELKSYIDSNMQLENFAHLASHELKTPLHNVTNLTSLLMKKTKSKLDQDELELMEMVTEEGGKMSKLIADLLQLSVVKNAELKFFEIDANSFLDQLLDGYFKEYKTLISKNVAIKTIRGHKDLLAQLFINLIQNALKFSKNVSDQRVEINGFENKESYQFSVSDNGIGIKPEYKEQVFLIFKRLHNTAEYSGTGIGLSICKSVVEKHKGDIWIKDNPQGGTIFEFTLSKRLE